MFNVWVVDDEHNLSGLLNQVLGKKNYVMNGYIDFVDAYESLSKQISRCDIFFFDVRLSKGWTNNETINKIIEKEKWHSLNPECAGSFLFAKAIQTYGRINALIHTAHGQKYDVLELLNMAKFLPKNIFELCCLKDNISAIQNSMTQLKAINSERKSLEISINNDRKTIEFPNGVSLLKSYLGISDRIITDAKLDGEVLCIEDEDPKLAFPKIYETIFDAQKIVIEEGRLNGEILTNKLMDLLLNESVDEGWWTEAIGEYGEWSMGSFLCKDHLYFKDFFSRDQGRLKELLKVARYNLSKITSSGLNLGGIKDVTHPDSFTKKYGSVCDVVGEQLAKMKQKIDLWPGKTELPQNYMIHLESFLKHITSCNNNINNKSDCCLTCRGHRESLRTTPQKIIAAIASIDNARQINTYNDEISIFFPFNEMFSDLLKNLFSVIKKTNDYTEHVVMSLTETEVSSNSSVSGYNNVVLKYALFAVFDNGESFQNVRGEEHSMSACTCGDMVYCSDYRYCGRFYIGSRIQNKWEWVDYLNSQDEIPNHVKSIIENYKDLKEMTNSYVFEIPVYDHQKPKP